MKKEYELLLSVLEATVSGKELSWQEPLSEPEFAAFYRCAVKHSILPLAVDKLHNWPLFEQEKHAYMLSMARNQVILQARRTAEFHLFYQYLGEQGLRPLLMKGIILRSLYPIPEQRNSVDEDLLISPEEIKQYHKACLAYGLRPVEPLADIEKEFEVSYEDPSRSLYIEIHKTPFTPDSASYGFLNKYFTDSCAHAVRMEIDGITFYTLAPTEHLLFLILHAYKHFLHGGIGIRQICDLNLFAHTFADSIRWEHLVQICQEAHISCFAKALFLIGTNHLGIENALPLAWQSIKTDELPLLDDVMSGGLYGVDDENRAHSSTITMNAAQEASAGRASRTRGLLKATFPDFETMAKRYPYVRKHPVLLPFSWAARIAAYLKKTKRVKNLSSKESIKIGNQRIELMKKYRIIE